MNLDIGKVIIDILSTNEDVALKVEGRIFPILAKEDTAYPFIVYKRSGLIPAYTKDKYSVEDTVFIDVIVIAAKYKESVDLANSVRKALERKRGVFSGIKITDIRLAGADEDGEDVFIQGLSFEVTIEN